MRAALSIGRAARVRQPDQPRDLVERLAGGVVERVGQVHDRGADEVAHEQQRGVAAGHDQPDRAVGQRAVLEGVGGGVAGEVVHAVERHAQAQREGLGRGDADVQRGGQSGSCGDGDGADVGRVMPAFASALRTVGSID